MSPTPPQRPSAWPLPGGTSLAIFLTCLAVYLLFYSGNQYSIDGVFMFQSAKALLFQRSFQMDNPVVWSGLNMRVSTWPVGLTLVYVPVLALLDLTVFRGDPRIRQTPYDPRSPANPELLYNRVYAYAGVVNVVITALTAVVVYHCARRLGFSPRWSAGLALIFGLASPSAAYARYDFAQPLAGLLLASALLCLLAARSRGTLGLVLSGLLAGGSTLARPELALIAVPPFALAALFTPAPTPRRLPRPGQLLTRAAAFGAPVLLFLLLSRLIDAARFGTPLSFGYSGGAGMFDLFIWRLDHILGGVRAYLVSPGRSLFLHFPLALLSLVGIVVGFKRDRIVTLLSCALCLVSLLLYSAWVDWAGGWAWGPRFFIPLIPFFVLLAGFGVMALPRRPRWAPSLLLSVLIGLSFLVALQGLLFDWLSFLIQVGIPPELTAQNAYVFYWRYSPAFADWSKLGQPLAYDILWIRNLQLSRGLTLLPLLLLFGACVLLGQRWLRYFLTPAGEPAPQPAEQPALTRGAAQREQPAS